MMTRPKHYLVVLAALLMILGGLYSVVSIPHAPAHAFMATVSAPCDHCPDRTAPSDRLCAMACAMTAAIVPDTPIVAARAKLGVIAPRPASATDRASRPDPYPPRPIV